MTAPAEDPRGGEAEIPRFVIVGEWLAEETDEHTCGTGRDGHYGAHEPGCGLVPVMPLRELDERLRATLLPPAAGRGDTDSGGEDDRPVPIPVDRVIGQEIAALHVGRQSGSTRLARHITEALTAVREEERAARAAGDRAQPTEGLREATARWLCENRYGEGTWDHFSVHEHDHWRGRSDALLAGPLAALLDAQAADRAKVARVEALIADTEGWQSWINLAPLRRALGGTT